MKDVIDHVAIERGRKDSAWFIERFLINPETGEPFKLLDAEKQFLVHAFKTDKRGRLLYPEQVYGAPKKSGKTGFAAIYAIAFLLLYGGRLPEAICCANDFDQSVGRVFAAIRNTIEASPALRAAAKITGDRITLADATIIAIPSDYASAAGSNQNLAILDELWAFSSERARRLFDELVPPPTRKIAARLTVTHAGFSGESVLLEELYKRGIAQPEVEPSLRAGDGLLMAWHHAPVAPWQDEIWLADMRRSLRPGQYLRMVQNEFVATESTFVDMAAWDACVDGELSPVLKDRSLPVFVGVDASVKHDSTAVVAVTWDPRAQKVRLVAHRIFQPSPNDPLDFERTIEDTVRDFAARFNVRRVLFDPFQMMATSQRLSRMGVRIEEFPQSSPNLTAASQNLYELITGRNLVAYPDPAMRLAVSRAVAVESSRGWRITKEKQSHKIDVVVALAMACHAAIGQGSVAPSADDLWRAVAQVQAMPKRNPDAIPVRDHASTYYQPMRGPTWPSSWTRG